ncbi:MAG TPA: AAA family ATPase [Lamprocystis sp. (in: g-proteobacteria)]|nr:AAA family ATPase [Lamprocystis sp. (in: g-proteobacteria)]
MIPRQIEPTLRRLAASFPIIAVTGPRQSGKTTLARALFADRPYVSLEDPAERTFALEDPKGFLARFAQGAVFDEAQRWPDLFSWLQGMVDAASPTASFSPAPSSSACSPGSPSRFGKRLVKTPKLYFLDTWASPPDCSASATPPPWPCTRCVVPCSRP